MFYKFVVINEDLINFLIYYNINLQKCFNSVRYVIPYNNVINVAEAVV